VDSFAIERVREYDAQVAIVLGSGLSSLVTDPARDRVIPYSEIGGLPRSTVKGHAGRFVLDEIGGRRVIFAQGRAHLYEGHSARDVTAGIRFLARAGIERLILTNAAGSLNPDFAPGSWMTISDHLNLTGTTPLLGSGGFVALTEAYSPAWRKQFAAAARARNVTLHEGVYAGVLGPQYETPAEVKMLRSLGADAIGMSTVCETIQARAVGMEVAGFSCLTNWAAGLDRSRLSHDEVLAAGKGASDVFAALLAAALAEARMKSPQPR
jgi:purine-nucleoside phosphorylase